jgi:hypothetical protein
MEFVVWFVGWLVGWLAVWKIEVSVFPSISHASGVIYSQKTFSKMWMDKLGYINSDLIYASKRPFTTDDSADPLQMFEDLPNCVNFQNFSDRNYDVSWKDPAKQIISCAEHYAFRSKWSEIKHRNELRDPDINITVIHKRIFYMLVVVKIRIKGAECISFRGKWRSKKFIWKSLFTGLRVRAVAWGTVLKAGRSRFHWDFSLK